MLRSGMNKIVSDKIKDGKSRKNSFATNLALIFLVFSVVLTAKSWFQLQTMKEIYQQNVETLGAIENVKKQVSLEKQELSGLLLDKKNEVVNGVELPSMPSIEVANVLKLEIEPDKSLFPDDPMPDVKVEKVEPVIAPVLPNEEDLIAALDQRAEQLQDDISWRTSIVDLLKVLNLPSNLDSRIGLSKVYKYQGSEDNNIELNLFLLKTVKEEIFAGKINLEIQ